jgi:hypothetical protein
VDQTRTGARPDHPGVRLSRIAARRLAGLSLPLMLAVIAASAHIRAAGGVDIETVRVLQRVAASSVALLVAALALAAWREPALRRPALAAFVLMLALSIVGWVTGTAPPPAAVFFNQFGGLALTALLAWIFARARTGRASDATPLAGAALLFGLAQAAFGSALAAWPDARSVIVLLLHAASGLGAAAALAALRSPAALACALLAPALGLAAALMPASAPATTLHAVSAALLVAAAGAARGRATATA